MKTLAKLKREPGIWLSDADKPNIASDEVLIKTRKTAICGTDLHIYKWNVWAQKTIPVPMHIGHEFVGDIVEIGKDVNHFAVGDRVSGEGHIVCGHCRNCRAGRRRFCRHTQGLGAQIPGAFAEYLAMPAINAYKLPVEVSDEVASILDPLGNAVHSALEFDLVGEDVLITGAGPVGLMAAAVAHEVGARHVVITDINDYRLGLAQKISGTVTVNPNQISLAKVVTQLGMTEGFDIGLEMSGSEHAFRDMLGAMNHGGKIAFLGVPEQDFAIDWHQVVFKSLTIKGIYGRRMFETWYKMVGMLQKGLNIDPIITHQFHIDDFQQGFDVMLSGQAGKVILNWA